MINVTQQEYDNAYYAMSDSYDNANGGNSNENLTYLESIDLIIKTTYTLL